MILYPNLIIYFLVFRRLSQIATYEGMLTLAIRYRRDSVSIFVATLVLARLKYESPSMINRGTQDRISWTELERLQQMPSTTQGLIYTLDKRNLYLDQSTYFK